MKTFIVSPWDFEMTVHADIEPAEPMTRDHPGAPAAADIFKVFVGGIDVFEMLSPAQLTRIEEHVLRQVD